MLVPLDVPVDAVGATTVVVRARPAKLEKGVESENIPPVPVEEEEGGGPP